MKPEFDGIQTTCVCGGKGSYIVTERTNINTVCGYSTHPCVCRKDLPPREGQARWWTTEEVFSGVAKMLLDPVTVSVSAEVPMSADNYRLVRRGNRYYGTFVDLRLDDGRGGMLVPDEARKLAQLLIQAADAADTIDNQDTDTCGHWAPCDCGQVKATVA